MNDADNPTEIECLYLFGLEFTGGGLPAGVPQINKPPYNSTINLGTIYGQGGATGTVKIKGRSLTANSTVVVSVGSGFSLSYGQQSGSSINIDAADVVLGCDVTVYATAYGTSGTILITSQTDSLSVEANLTSEVVEELAGVKLTGTQWLETDYHTNPQTKIVMDCLFEKNSVTENQSYSGRGCVILHCRDAVDSQLTVQTGQPNEQIAKAYSMQVWLQRSYDASAYNHFYEHIFGSESAFCNRTTLIVDAPNTLISFQGVSWATDTKTNTQEIGYLSVGCNRYNNTILNQFDLTVFSLKLYNGSTLVRDYSPKRINGVVGLLDSVTGAFISSKTSTALEPITTV